MSRAPEPREVLTVRNALSSLRSEAQRLRLLGFSGAATILSSTCEKLSVELAWYCPTCNAHVDADDHLDCREIQAQEAPL